MGDEQKRLTAANLHDPYTIKAHAAALERAGIPPALARDIVPLRIIAEGHGVNLDQFDRQAQAKPEEFAAEARNLSKRQSRDDGLSL